MRVVIAVETRFEQTGDGRVWSTGWVDAGFWQRYLGVFEEVCVLARVRRVDRSSLHARPAAGEQVHVAGLPYYKGPWQFVRRLPAIRRAVRATLRPTDAVILRVPGAVGTVVHQVIRKSRRPFGVEVLGDPLDVFAPGAVRSAFRPVARIAMSRSLKRQCRDACAAAYVTAETLQRRYPPGGALATSYSSVDLTTEAFVANPRTFNSAAKTRRILLVGSLEQLYKGPDVLLEAMARLARDGFYSSLTIVGDGRHRAELQELARSRGLSGRVTFRGSLPPGPAVYDEMDRCDLFVLPSRTEGLPRSMLEAMARGVPCVGSKAGGIPELLDEAELVPPGSAAALAEKIREVLSDVERLARLSARNLTKAREFHHLVLTPRRREFYETVRQATENWQRTPSS